ncbi:uncharacterized protein LOC116590236 [Mustela erminea]|uniref:uncharacterized protein LOC116590236 n=1 Tax=Mustela erminea TaxID=36723 RepID=UPI001386EE60|nr:uncharacterized protein LOC116590236 [Mustela erminea]
MERAPRSPCHAPAWAVCGDPLLGDPLLGDPLLDDPLLGDPLLDDPLLDDPLLGDPLLGDPLLGDPLLGDPLLLITQVVDVHYQPESGPHELTRSALDGTVLVTKPNPPALPVFSFVCGQTAERGRSGPGSRGSGLQLLPWGGGPGRAPRASRPAAASAFRRRGRPLSSHDPGPSRARPAPTLGAPARGERGPGAGARHSCLCPGSPGQAMSSRELLTMTQAFAHIHLAPCSTSCPQPKLSPLTSRALALAQSRYQKTT